MKTIRQILATLLVICCVITLTPWVAAVSAPTLTGAYVINDTQLLVTFSAPVTLDFSKSTRFAMRVIDANNNMASGTTDAYQTMADDKYTWANDEHTALIWTVAAGIGHPAETKHWQDIAAQQRANGNRVAFCIIDMVTTGDSNIDAVTSGGVTMQKMNTSGSGMAVVEMTERPAVTLLSAVATDATTVEMTFSEPVKITGNPMLAIRIVDPATDKIVESLPASDRQLLAQQPILSLNSAGTVLTWRLSDVDLKDWVAKKMQYPQYAVKVCILENPTAVNGKIDQVVDALSGREGLTATYSETGVREGACVELTSTTPPPTILSATAINSTQIRVEFSAPVTFDFTKTTRFAMRVIDENNNMVADTTDAYQTMDAGKFTWANDEHTALIWTVVAGIGHPASTAHWLEISAQQRAYGNRVAFCIIDMKTTEDSNIDAVTTNGVVMQRMNTSGVGMAVAELKNGIPVTLDKAEMIDDTQIELTFSEPVKITGNPMLAIRIVDPATDKIVDVSGNQLLAQQPNLSLDSTGTVLTWRLIDVDLNDWLAKKAQYPQYAVKVCILEDPVAVNGIVDPITDMTGTAGLKATYSESGAREAACVELTKKTIVRLESAQVMDDNTIQLQFSEPIKITGNPMLAIRVVDPATDKIVSELPNHVNQLLAQQPQLELSADGQTLTWTVTTDLSVWIRRQNDYPQYAVKVCVLENPVLVNGYIDAITDLSGQAALIATYSESGVREAACVALTDSRPQVDSITLKSAKMIDDGHIRLSFSAPIEIKGTPQIALTLVDSSNRVVVSDSGNAMVYIGAWEYDEDDHSKIIWRPKFLNAQGIKSLPELFAFGGAASAYADKGYSWKFRIAEVAGDGVTTVNGNGRIENLTGEDGRPVASNYIDPEVVAAESIFMKVGNIYPVGGLQVLSVKAVDDSHIDITFSAPIERIPGTFMAIRLVDQDGALLTDAQGENMQWTGSWVFANKKQTVIRWQFYSKNKFDINNLTDLFARKNLEGYDDYELIFHMGESSPAWGQNGLIDNIYKKKDPTTHLTGNLLAGLDGLNLPIEIDYTTEKIAVSAKVINEQQVLLSFSQPIKMVGGAPFMAVRYMRYGEQYFDGEFNNAVTVQFDGNWEWANTAHTQILWTMKGMNRYGGYNLYDVFHRSNGLARFDDASIAFCIEEVYDLEKGLRPGTDLVENIASTDGKTHLMGDYSEAIGGPDRCYIPLTYDISPVPITLERVVAVDDQTLELHFSEQVIFKEGEQSPTMGVRYVNELGSTGVVADGKSAYFQGNYRYKEEDPSVIIWELNLEKSRGAKSLTEIFNFEGRLRFNNDMQIVFAIMDNEKSPGCTWDLRVDGVTDVDGVRKLKANRVAENGIVFCDIEIDYDLPASNLENKDEETQEEPVVYRSNYTIPIGIGAAIIVLIPLVVGLVVAKKNKGDAA